jgi:TrpR-related protein YerC/YecD
MTTPQDDWHTDDVDALCDALLSLDSVDEMAAFLRDVCTHREIQELAGRWAVVRHLADGLAYREIAARTGASTATITRVNQWLQRGTGGYQIALARTHQAPTVE